jgi:hypothetical protein
MKLFPRIGARFVEFPNRWSWSDVAWPVVLGVALLLIAKSIRARSVALVKEEVNYSVSPFVFREKLAVLSTPISGNSLLVFRFVAQSVDPCHSLTTIALDASVVRFSSSSALGIKIETPKVWRCSATRVGGEYLVSASALVLDSALAARVRAQRVSLAVVDSNGEVLLSFSADTSGSGKLIRQYLFPD